MTDNKLIKGQPAKEYFSVYYQTHKDKYSEKMSEKVPCPCCGASVRRDFLVKHKRSKKCLIVSENNRLNQQIKEATENKNLVVICINKST